MRYIQLLNLVLFAAGTMMTLVLGVVCMMLLVHYEAALEIGTSVDTVAASTGVFAVLAAAGAAAVWAVHRRHPVLWVAEGGLCVALALVIQFVRQLA